MNKGGRGGKGSAQSEAPCDMLSYTVTITSSRNLETMLKSPALKGLPWKTLP